MSRVHLRFATDILRRFGEELNPNPDQGILELVKNAYDADARLCTIELLEAHEPGGTIRVTDNGDGMDEDDILNGWLVLGRSSKSVGQTTRLGRIPAGNKGLGRLAALRMGDAASLITRPKDDSTKEYQLKLDWKAFDKADVVEDVNLDLRSGRRPPKAESGTVIEISGLSASLNRNDVKRLARGILLLADPFGDNPAGFLPILKAPEFADLEKLVQSRYFNDAEFHLTASVDEFGLATAVVTDYRGEELFRAEHNEISSVPGAPLYRCPPAQFDLWVFILASQTFTARQTTVEEVRAWLREFGGVHLYLNGLRVAPYGNPGNDWLDMNLKRVRHPELRPGTNTSIGRFSVVDVENVLPQKTDRSGMVESASFNELKRFAQDALDWMGRERLRERENKRALERVEAPKNVKQAQDNLEATIVSLPPQAQSKLRKPLELYIKQRDQETQSLRKEVQLYRTLSTTGITASVFGHESRNPIRLILQNAQQVARRGPQYLGDRYAETIGRSVSRILKQVETLRSFATLTLSFIDNEKRRIARVDVHPVITNVLQVFGPLMKEREVEPIPKLAEGNPYLRGSEAALESVVTNLLVNSLKAFERVPPKKRQIEVRTEIEGRRVYIHVLDNGPGIQDINVKDIWLPGETTDPNGTGLGLTIVRDTVRDLGGEVTVIAEGELGGAEFIVELPIIGA